MDQITVKELMMDLIELYNKGYGDKKIVISDDNEGNGYHGCFFGATHEGVASVINGLLNDSAETDPNNIVVIG